MPDDALVVVFRAATPVAHVVRGALQANGIDTVISIDSAAGEAPNVARLLVRSEDVEEARQLIAEVEAQPS